MSAVEIKPVSGGVGVELANIDIGKGMSDADFEAIQSAFVENGLVFFRDQNISPEQHIEFAERWGEINVNRFSQKSMAMKKSPP